MTASAVITTEVCVLGGGPAGSSIAHRLAQLGHQVCLVERAPFPRPHVGESLPPSILPVLDLLEVRSRIEQAGFLRSGRSRIRWLHATDGWKLSPGEAGFLVDRGQFDQLLLEAAQTAGVQVLQPAHARRPQRLGEQQWRIPVYWDDGLAAHVGQIQAKFLVDATGKHSTLLEKPQRQGAFTLALYGYWRDTGLPEPEPQVEAGANEWYWGAPLPNGDWNIAVFVDAQRRVGMNRHALNALYQTLLAQSTLLHRCLDGVLVSGLLVCDASCYQRQSTVTTDCIAVGEAAFSIDPLSSQGVQAAMMSAFQGSIVVHTLLSDPENRASAIAFYQQRQQDAIAHHQAIAAQLYGEQDWFKPTPFWQTRATSATIQEVPPTLVPFDLIPGDRVQLSHQTQMVETPVIQGNQIRRMSAIQHPSLARPVAYLGHVAIAPLLSQISPGQTSLELLQTWACTVPLEQSWAILQWLWTQTILVPWAEPN